MWEWLDSLGTDYWMGGDDGLYGVSGIESAPALDPVMPSGFDYGMGAGEFEAGQGSGLGYGMGTAPATEFTYGMVPGEVDAGAGQGLGIGVPSSLSPSLWDKLLQYGSRVVNGGSNSGVPGYGGAGDDSSSDGLLGLGIGASPFLLSLALAKSQGGDIDQRIRNIEGINSQFAKAQTDPYDLETGYGRAALNTDLGLRGVAGSSFGNQALNNYDVTRAMGRNDILSRALMSGYTTALGAKVQNNATTNALLGRGLDASARLFAPPPETPEARAARLAAQPKASLSLFGGNNDPFGLRRLTLAAPGVFPDSSAYG